MKDNKKVINGQFKAAREVTETALGIKLTLIELVELRGLVEFTIDSYNESRKKVGRHSTHTRTINTPEGPRQMADEKYENLIDPAYEASLIFMNQNYGTQIRSRFDIDKYNCQRSKDEDLIGYDFYPEYFKRVQEEMHFP